MPQDVLTEQIETYRQEAEEAVLNKEFEWAFMLLEKVAELESQRSQRSQSA